MRRPESLICLECSKRFSPRKRGGKPQKYCSVICRSRAKFKMNPSGRMKSKAKYRSKLSSKIKEREQYKKWAAKNRAKRAESESLRRSRKNGNKSGASYSEWLKELRSKPIFRCYWCCEDHPISALEVDHYIPIKLGGVDGLENVVAACCRCNRRKGSLHPHQWIGRLLSESHPAWV